MKGKYHAVVARFFCFGASTSVPPSSGVTMTIGSCGFEGIERGYGLSFDIVRDLLKLDGELKPRDSDIDTTDPMTNSDSITESCTSLHSLHDNSLWLVLVDADCFRPHRVSIEIYLNSLGYSRLVKFKRGERASVFIERSKSGLELRSGKAPFVVVTNWKEAKGCLDLFVGCCTIYNATLIVIVCDNGSRSFESAERWVDFSLPECVRSKVLLCQTWESAFDALACWRISSSR